MFEQKLYLHLSKLKTILMLFIITRASYNYDEQPHPKARKKIIPNYSIHENWTEAYYNSISPNKLWRSVGTGHTTINKDAGIKRTGWRDHCHSLGMAYPDDPGQPGCWY